MAAFCCASGSAFSIAKPSFCSFCRISIPLYFPEVARTGSEPTKQRRHHNLIAKHEVVDDRVMAVELPAPGFSGGRLAHDGDVVEPFPRKS